MRRAVLLVLLLLVGVFGTASAQSSDTLIWSLIGGDISTLNPALITDGNSFAVANVIYSGLFNANPMTGQPDPDLATWTVSDDGLRYTFTLNGATWSDGTPITSADVKFTYDAIMSDIVKSPRRSDIALIDSIEIIDDQSFVVTLKEATCAVWGGAFGSLVPMPSHLYAADFSDFMTNPNNLAPSVASGPYMFSERSPGEFVRLVANPMHYEGTPQIPNLLFRIVADATLLNQSLQTGTVDYGFMYPDQYDQLGSREMFNSFLYPNANSPIVIMNYQDSENPQNAYDADGNLVELVPNRFFGDVRVRRAIAQGYDKQALALTLGEEAGSVQLSGPIVPAFYGAYDMSVIEPWQYNPEAAAALLDEAGWIDTNGNGIRDKDGVEFEVDLVYSRLVDLWANAALIMQDQLSDLGIKINIVEQEWSAYLGNVLLPGKFDITIVGFGGGTEVDGIAYNLLYSKNIILNGGGFNLSAYVNPELDALLDQARNLPGCDVGERYEIYKQVQQIARDDVPYDWLVSTTAVHVLNARVQNAFIGQWEAVPRSIIGWGL